MSVLSQPLYIRVLNISTSLGRYETMFSCLGGDRYGNSELDQATSNSGIYSNYNINSYQHLSKGQKMKPEPAKKMLFFPDIFSTKTELLIGCWLLV